MRARSVRIPWGRATHGPGYARCRPTPPDPWHHGPVRASSDPAAAISYWLRDPAPPGTADPPLATGEHLDVDVAIVGGGFTGLWTAIALTDTDPAIRVAVLEMETVAFGASGRNGGFCEASLTHGLANGIRHFPDELERLEREGIDNLHGLIDFTRAHGIDCDLEETGTLALADQPHQVDEFRAWVDEAAEYGEHLEFLDGEAARAEVHSPLWHAALYRPPGRDILVDPARLCRGIARVARERGVRIHEQTRVTNLERRAGGVLLTTADGATVRAGHVVVATSAYSGWLRRLSPVFVPVYDYVLVSDPLTPDQRASIGWARRQGLSDANNQFHYFRLTADDRILWGGYDAIHHYGSRVAPELDRRPAHLREARGPVLPGVPAARWPGLPLSLGRRDRHDVAFHGDLRSDDGRSGDVCPGLHRPGRRREPLGGWRGPRLHPPTRRGSPAASPREQSAGPVPARAPALRGRGDGPARTRPRRPQRGAARSSSSRPSTPSGSASTPRAPGSGRPHRCTARSPYGHGRSRARAAPDSDRTTRRPSAPTCPRTVAPVAPTMAPSSRTARVDGPP